MHIYIHAVNRIFVEYNYEILFRVKRERERKKILKYNQIYFLSIKIPTDPQIN